MDRDPAGHPEATVLSDEKPPEYPRDHVMEQSQEHRHPGEYRDDVSGGTAHRTKTLSMVWPYLEDAY